MKFSFGAKALMVLAFVVLAGSQYYIFPFWGNDPATAKTLLLTGAAMGYASLAYELLVRLHQSCPIRRMRARRNGPTVLHW